MCLCLLYLSISERFSMKSVSVMCVHILVDDFGCMSRGHFNRPSRALCLLCANTNTCVGRIFWGCISPYAHDNYCRYFLVLGRFLHARRLINISRSTQVRMVPACTRTQTWHPFLPLSACINYLTGNSRGFRLSKYCDWLGPKYQSRKEICSGSIKIMPSTIRNIFLVNQFNFSCHKSAHTFF